MATNTNENKKKTTIWKVLKTAAIVGGAVFVGASLISTIGLSIGIGAYAATMLANVTLVGALAGIGTMAASAAVAATTGLVNGMRFIFSKNYRDRVLERRRERINARRQARNNSRNQDRSQEPIIEQPTPVIEQPTPVIEQPTPIVEEPIKKSSGKAGGMYDKLSDENKEIYDSIIKKNSAEHLFSGLSRAEVVVLKYEYNEVVKACRKKIKDGETLTPEEEKNLATAAALRSKASTYIKNHESVESASAFENDEEKKKAKDAVSSRIAK